MSTTNSRTKHIWAHYDKKQKSAYKNYLKVLYAILMLYNYAIFFKLEETSIKCVTIIQPEKLSETK